jgi:hypothetical protein
MTMRVWLGSMLECSVPDERNTGCAQAAAGRADRSSRSWVVKLMEPAPPG